MEELKLHHEGTKDTKKSRMLLVLRFEVLLLSFVSFVPSWWIF